MPTQTATRPFLKWPGGKLRLVNTIVPHLPKAPLFIEPFVGAGALFLNTEYPQYQLNDLNKDVIQLFKLLKKRPQSFINDAERLFTLDNNHAEAYYHLRDQFNQCRDPYQRACLFIYLNRHGFNGLCRYNQKGYFNVPFGCHPKPYFPAAGLLSFSAKLRQAQLYNLDYREIFQQVLQQTDTAVVFYCDPPYSPLNNTARFSSYTYPDFAEQDHIELAKQARRAQQHGHRVIISNHDTPFTRDLYQGADIIRFTVRRTISCKTDQRNRAPELLAIF